MFGSKGDQDNSFPEVMERARLEIKMLVINHLGASVEPADEGGGDRISCIKKSLFQGCFSKKFPYTERFRL